MIGGAVGDNGVILEVDPSDGGRLRSYAAPDLDRVFAWSPAGDRIAWSTLGDRGAGGRARR